MGFGVVELRFDHIRRRGLALCEAVWLSEYKTDSTCKIEEMKGEQALSFSHDGRKRDIGAFKRPRRMET